MKHEGHEFIQRLLSDDPEAERRFFAHYSPLVRRVAMAAGFRWEDAEEISQEALMGALQSIRVKQGLDDPQKLGAFVHGTARVVIAQFRRDSAKHWRILDGVGSSHDASASLADCSPEREIWKKEFRQRCDRVLSLLRPRYRRFLNDYYIRDLDTKALCRKLEIKPGNCRVLHHRALEAFASKAEQQGILTELLDMMHNMPD